MTLLGSSWLFFPQRLVQDSPDDGGEEEKGASNCFEENISNQNLQRGKYISPRSFNHNCPYGKEKKSASKYFFKGEKRKQEVSNLHLCRKKH